MRHLGNFLLRIIPSSHFTLKRILLRFMAIHVGSGAKVNVGFQVFGAGQVRIGKGTWVGPNCRIHTAGNYGVTVEENCDIGPEVVFVCGSHELANWERRAGLGKASPSASGNHIQ